MTALARFWPKVDKDGPEECWNWAAAKMPRGYGVFRFPGHNSGLAHRFAYQQFVGPIPEDLCVCHHCDNPSCVNPAHLFLGTQADNIRDMDEKGRRVRGDIRGEKNGLAKLRLEDIPAIRALRGKRTARQIGRIYGVTREAISSVLNGYSWAWVP